ncbi:protein translocase subunit SecF, partial [bacterium]|nr:protein translocase subunit SecF [bacterium]
VYYTLTGVVADIAVILNLIFLMAGMALFNATLTLPGIAGIILTIGMAVDANVLIFERLREEMKTKRSQSLPLILDKGYGRAFMTIFDANLTTLITAVILFQFGTGPIKGFAITLSLGILVSMFTAVFVSRVIQDVLYASGMQTLHLGFIKFFANANFDFFKKPKLAMSITGLVGVVGFVVLVMGWQSGELKGIDFSGGAEIYAKFDDTIEVQNVRDSLENAGLKNAVIQSVLDQENEVLIRVGEGVVTQPDELTTIVEKAMPGKSFETIGSNIVGAKVGGELLWKALNCLIFSSIGILLYITARFEFRFAVASVITLFHDLLFTLAILAFVGTEFNLPTIAALLTVLGYSLNDTIVIFDRIRENYRSAVLDFRQMVNLSINQTLARTTNTSLTTFLVVLVLYLFAGSVIHDFALTLMIGVVIGTYSSIFVASPILFLMTQGGKKGIKERKKAMIEEAES